MLKKFHVLDFCGLAAFCIVSSVKIYFVFYEMNTADVTSDCCHC